MRRRIYIDPESDLSDDTDKAYLFDPDYDFPEPGSQWRICQRGALYAEGLWRQYEAACAEVSRLRSEIIDTLVAEPYDEVELGARSAMDTHSTMEVWNAEEHERIRQLLLDHAATRTKP